MSNRPEITKELSQAVEKYINPHNDPRIYWAREVTFDYATSHAIRVDYMRFKPINNSTSGIEHGDFYCYEIKSSIDDFESPHGHNFIGDYNYYVMPREVYDEVKKKIPYYVGVLVPTGNWYAPLESVKNAKRYDRQYNLATMLFMMYRSSNRDKEKYRKQMEAQDD